MSVSLWPILLPGSFPGSTHRRRSVCSNPPEWRSNPVTHLVKCASQCATAAINDSTRQTGMEWLLGQTFGSGDSSPDTIHVTETVDLFKWITGMKCEMEWRVTWNKDFMWMKCSIEWSIEWSEKRKEWKVQWNVKWNDPDKTTPTPFFAPPPP